MGHGRQRISSGPRGGREGLNTMHLPRVKRADVRGERGGRLRLWLFQGGGATAYYIYLTL